MKKKIEEKIEIPHGFNVDVDGTTIKIAKDSVMIEKKMPFNLKKHENFIIIEKNSATKNDKKLIKTSLAHIKNIFSGLEKKFVYKLQICNVHFPMNVERRGEEIVIKNFLGEVKERKAKILPGIEVKVEKDIIIVSGHDKEKAGQTAANIETATRIKSRDRRVFQDGIFLIEKEKGKRKEK